MPGYTAIRGILHCPLCNAGHAWWGWVYGEAGGEIGRDGARGTPWIGDPELATALCRSASGRSPSRGTDPFHGLPVGRAMLRRAWRSCRARRRGVVLVAGAGISRASSVPTLQDVVAGLGVSPASQRGLALAQREPAVMFEAIANLVSSVDGAGARPGRCHHLIHALQEAGAVDWVLTTNGDRLLEQAGVDVVRVFDSEEMIRWESALKEEGDEQYKAVVDALLEGRIGMWVTVGASCLIPSELGRTLDLLLRRHGVERFLINPERPIHAEGSHWVCSTGEEILAWMIQEIKIGRRA